MLLTPPVDSSGSALVALASQSMLTRYAESAVGGVLWLFGAGVGLSLFALALRRGIPAKNPRRVAIGLLVVIALLALVHAWRLRWLCDDAFISFRYADNWARGRGLVYNPGERVEGYTNFLWTALLTLGSLLGAHPGHVSLVLSLGCLVGAVVWTERLTRRLLPDGARLPGLLAAAGLAASYLFASFGTSGLETMAAALLVVVAVERAEAASPLAAGTAGILATLLHPDHAIFYAVLGVVLGTLPPPRTRRLLLYSAPFLVLFVPYFFARYAYYGDFFPNTYYAKSADKLYFSQGVLYLVMSALVAGLFGVLPLASFGVYLARASVFARFVTISIPVYLLYVAKVGGDFMLGRLLCSVLPLLLIAAELGVRSLIERKSPALAVVGLVALAPVALPNGVVYPGEKFRHVADERTFYRLTSLRPITVDSGYSIQAKKLRRIFRDAPRPPKLAVGAIGLVGYLTRYPIMDTFGLVNREIARMRIRERGRPGHEKVATPGHIFEQSVDFTDLSVWPDEYAKWAAFRVYDTDFFIVRYDPRFAKSVRSDGTKLPYIEDRILKYDPKERSAEKVACDLWFFDQIFFSHQRNDKLRGKLGEALAKDDASFAGLADLVVGPLPAGEGAWRKRPLFTFDDFRSWSVAGDAFARGPLEREPVGQQRVYGTRGRFVNSYTSSLGDAAKGTLRSPKFRIEGDALTLSVAGGRTRRVQVRLLVGDQVVASATGCGTDVVGRRVFPTAAHRGREAELEIVDRGSRGWDHLIVDEVVEWTRIRR